MEWILQPSQGDIPPNLTIAEIKYYEGFIYLAGGTANDILIEGIQSFYRYDLSQSKWENITRGKTYESVSYTGSALINGYFYLLFGWDNYASVDTSAIMRVSLNSTDYIWEYFINGSQFSRDSFATSARGSDIIIFGGFIQSKGETLNSLISLSTTTGVIRELNSNIITPSPRFSHLINSEIYIFGGSGENGLLNDMWIYNIDTNAWRTLVYQGTSPSARFLHASDSQGDAIALWGGEDSTGLKNDLFIFNALNNEWTLITPSSINIPAAAKGACLVLDFPFMYIYGGITNLGISNQLWVFDTGLNSYTQISQDNGVAYATCEIIDNNFYVIFGSRSGDEPLGSIRKYNIASGIWETYYDQNYTNLNSAQAIQIFIGSAVIKIGGQAWQLDPSNQLLIYSNNNQLIVGSIPDYTYAMGFTYYGTKIYSFGGGSTLGKLLRVLDASQVFFSLDVFDICKGGICQALCSKGTYNSSNQCIKCPAGSYSQYIGSSQCIKCPPGTYSLNGGATSSRQCYPCPDGSFQDIFGASYCLDCPVGKLCPVGTQVPMDSIITTEYYSVQPDIYKSAYSYQLALIFQLTIGMTMVALIILIGISGKVKNHLYRFDIFTSLHNHELKKNMILDKTKIGGLFSLIYAALAMIIIGATIIIYQTDNIQESKALLPSVILQNEVNEFISSVITISASFIRYGDSCVFNNSCSSGIKLEYLNIDSTAITYTCTFTSDNSCIVKVYCEECIINTGASVLIILNEPLSYSSGIQVNVTSDSSIPESISSITSLIYPSNNYVFIGPVASQFYFTMTPSLFRSDSDQWSGQSTGYHISSESLPTPGSEYLSIEIPVASQLKLNIILNKDIASLYTYRFLKQTFLFLISGLLGSVFGAMGAVGSGMKFFENYYLIQKSKRKKHTFSELMEIRKNIKMHINKRKRMKTDETLENHAKSDGDLNNFIIRLV